MKYILLITVAAALILAGCAEPTQPTGQKLLSVARTTTTVGVPYDMVITDDYIFLAEDQGGFSISNRDTGETIVRKTTYGDVFYENVRQVAYIEETNILLVYERYGGRPAVHFWKIADPANPIYVDSYVGDGIRNMRYIWAESDGTGQTPLGISMTTSSFRWGEVTSPTHAFPNYLIYDEYSLPNALNTFAIQDNYVYFAAAQRGMYVFDLTTKQVVAELNMTGDAVDIAVKGNYAYICAKHEGMLVADITDPTNPVWLTNSTYKTSGWAQSASVEGDYLAIGSGGGGVYLFDIGSTPEKPRFLDRMTSFYTDYVYFVKLHNGELFTAGRYKGVTKFTIKK